MTRPVSCREPAAPVFLALLLLASACSGETKYIGTNRPVEICASAARPPEALGLDGFYEKYVDARGLPIVSSARVADAALEQACNITVRLLERSDVRGAMIESGMRVAVLGRQEVLTDLPEYSDLYSAMPGTDWNNEIRSYGATVGRPVSFAAEENLLCLSSDLFSGEALLVHSLAHGLRRLGILRLEPTWDERLRAAYDDAISSGLWSATYAATDHEQYWAEGVQDWYDANQQANPPDGLHNHVNTRAELTAYDFELASLIGEYFPDDSWRPTCP
jgi:hypothetical protein